MPFVSVPSAASVETRFTYFNQQIENAWAVQITDPDEAALLAVASIFETGLQAFMEVASADLVLREIFVKNLELETGPEATLTITPGQTGGVPSGGEPGNVTFCMSLRSGLAGRSFRGRKYMPGIPIGQVTAGVVGDLFVDGCLQTASDLIAALAANATPLAVVSKTLATVVPVTAVSAVDRYSDSMRSRLLG